jgi:fatty-acyl-CoA synthase
MTESSCGDPVLETTVLETTVGGILRDAAERAAGTLALVEGVADPGARRRWSYADLLADSERVARALLGRFEPGERVAVWAPNSPEWLLMEFGGGAGRADAGDGEPGAAGG